MSKFPDRIYVDPVHDAQYAGHANALWQHEKSPDSVTYIRSEVMEDQMRMLRAEIERLRGQLAASHSLNVLTRVA